MAKKSTALLQLEAMANEAARRKYPLTPPQYLAPRVYSEKCTNSVTKAIIDFLRLSGNFAERVNTTGLPVDRRKTFTDVLGNQRTIGRIEWRRSTSEKGSADIHATIGGRFVAIEVKFGNDKQSEHQKAYQQKVEAAGGVYVIAKTFEGFFKWYNEKAPRLSGAK